MSARTARQVAEDVLNTEGDAVLKTLGRKAYKVLEELVPPPAE